MKNFSSRLSSLFVLSFLFYLLLLRSILPDFGLLVGPMSAARNRPIALPFCKAIQDATFCLSRKRLRRMITSSMRSDMQNADGCFLRTMAKVLALKASRLKVDKNSALLAAFLAVVAFLGSQREREGAFRNAGPV
jgi:hypothetical protein